MSDDELSRTVVEDSSGVIKTTDGGEIRFYRVRDRAIGRNAPPVETVKARVAPSDSERRAQMRDIDRLFKLIFSQP